MIKRYFLFLILVLFSFISDAVIKVYKFEDIEKEKQFNLLVQELRCPKCQNNNLADSNSDLSVDLKSIIYEKVIAGETNQQITGYLKERYGDFISYRPPVKPSTWFIWFGPFIFLAIGVFAIIRFLSTQKKADVNKVTGNVSQESHSMIQQWNDELLQESIPQDDKLNVVEHKQGSETS